MYLKLLENDEEKVVFMQLANIVAIACCEEGRGNEDSDNRNSSCSILDERSAVYSMLAEDTVDTVDVEGWQPSAKEKKILQGYWDEMKCESHTGVFGGGVYIRTSKFEKVIEELDEALRQVDSLDESARRKAIIKKMFENCVDWDKVPEMSLKTGKIIMLELLGLALVDHDYAELERYAIELIAAKLGVDDDELEEMEEFINSYMKKIAEGLEIISA
jgi:hypothetical protein